MLSVWRAVICFVFCVLFAQLKPLSQQEKLKKRRELLTEKMKAEQKEQEQIRNEEQKVLK